MKFNFKHKKTNKIFTEIATKGFAESVKVLLTAITTGIAHSPSLGLIVGAGAKAFMDTLLLKTSQVEKKLDILIREPLLTGIYLLSDGILYPDSSSESIKYKNQILHDAHISLIKASIFAVDSFEDTLFIKSLDLLALSAHSSHWQIAITDLKRTQIELNKLILEVEMLEKQLKIQLEDINNEYGDILSVTPALPDLADGYGEQAFYSKDPNKDTFTLSQSVKDYRQKVDILVSISSLAQQFINLNSNK